MARGADDVTYELVGSRIIVSPRHGSSFSESETIEVAYPALAGVPAVEFKAVGPSPPPVSRPPGPPPKMTLGIAARMFVARLCDRSLLTDYAFIVYVAGIALGQCGYINNLTFLPSYRYCRYIAYSVIIYNTLHSL